MRGTTPSKNLTFSSVYLDPDATEYDGSATSYTTTKTYADQFTVYAGEIWWVSKIRTSCSLKSVGGGTSYVQTRLKSGAITHDFHPSNTTDTNYVVKTVTSLPIIVLKPGIYDIEIQQYNNIGGATVSRVVNYEAQLQFERCIAP